MNYAQRWVMAVALKQGYPSLDTGAVDSTTITALPPTFEVAQSSDAEKTERWKMAGYGAAGGLVVGGLIGVLMSPKRARARA